MQKHSATYTLVKSEFQVYAQATTYFLFMKAYSTDLRERVAAACQQGGHTIGEVAAQFSVSDSFVRKLRRRQRTSGSLAALP